MNSKKLCNRTRRTKDNQKHKQILGMQWEWAAGKVSTKSKGKQRNHLSNEQITKPAVQQFRSICDGMGVINFSVSNILPINLSITSSKCPMLNIISANIQNLKSLSKQRKLSLLPSRLRTMLVTSCVPKDTANKSEAKVTERWSTKRQRHR